MGKGIKMMGNSSVTVGDAGLVMFGMAAAVSVGGIIANPIDKMYKRSKNMDIVAKLEKFKAVHSLDVQKTFPNVGQGPTNNKSGRGH
jgi:hypothetical protein